MTPPEPAPVPADQDAELRDPHKEIIGLFQTLIACSVLWAKHDDERGVASAAMNDGALKLADFARTIATLRAERDQLAADLREARETIEALRMGIRLAAEMRERGRDAERRYAEWRWNNPIVRAAITPDPHHAAGSASGKEETDG